MNNRLNKNKNNNNKNKNKNKKGSLNIIKHNNNTLLFESYWRNDINQIYHVDLVGNIFPYPYNLKYWPGKDQFVDKLTTVHNDYKKYNDKDSFIIKMIFEHTNKCLLCNDKISTFKYKIFDFLWEESLIHYITKHNVKPSNEFIDLIFKYVNPLHKKNKIIKYNKKIYIVHYLKYIKITKNQIMIMDALLTHGGYSKKYYGDKNTVKYSEHSGLLDFNMKQLQKIIISGKTNRIDATDDEIYLPYNIPDALEYEYIFHTHPPTPLPGSRAEYGILYDFPSTNDILHFLSHYNEGLTQGSIVVASEGLYNIRKHIFDRQKINIEKSETVFEKQLDHISDKIQNMAINKYGFNFTQHEFYSVISQDMLYINMFNTFLNKNNIHIDYYPRIYDTIGNWIIDDLYLPIHIIEPYNNKNMK